MSPEREGVGARGGWDWASRVRHSFEDCPRCKCSWGEGEREGSPEGRAAPKGGRGHWDRVLLTGSDTSLLALPSPAGLHSAPVLVVMVGSLCCRLGRGRTHTIRKYLSICTISKEKVRPCPTWRLSRGLQPSRETCCTAERRCSSRLPYACEKGSVAQLVQKQLSKVPSASTCCPLPPGQTQCSCLSAPV